MVESKPKIDLNKSLQVKINLSPEERISCQYHYTRGYTCIIDNTETQQSQFFGVDFTTAEYSLSPSQDDATSSQEISKMLIHHESCLPGQPNLDDFIPKVRNTTEKPDFIEIDPDLEKMFAEIVQARQKSENQAA